MSELATTIPPKGYGSLQARDWLKGLYYAVVGSIVLMFYFLVENLLQEHPHWPTWNEWLPLIKGFVQAFAGYIIGKIGVNNVGQIFQKDKPIVHVDAEDLKKVVEKAAEADGK